MPTTRELDHAYRMRKLQLWQSIGQGIVKIACTLVTCGFLYLSLRQLAGRQTIADLRFKAIADLKANRWLALSVPWGVASLATAWGAGERYLRKRHIKRVSSETSELQKMIDPQRRSSGLSRKGETNPEDI